MKKVSIVPLEVIVRNISAGSFAKRYGVEEGIVFDEPTFEFSYKNDDLGDPLLYVYLFLKLATRDEIALIRKYTMMVNDLLRGFMKEIGIDLVDFKLEFGKTADGTIVLADEISPDTCRLWDEKTHEKLDKDRFRRDLGGAEEPMRRSCARLMGTNKHGRIFRRDLQAWTACWTCSSAPTTTPTWVPSGGHGGLRQKGRLPAADPQHRNTPFRTKFDKDLSEFHGCAAIGCISDTDPQPLLVRSHLGLYAITTVGIINNADALVERYFSDHGHQFLAMSSGKVNSTELAAALINQEDDLVSGIRRAQAEIDGSCTILILTPDAIVAARDRLGRLPVLVGQTEDGCCVSFESFAYHKLGYHDAYELGPGEIVKVTPGGWETLSPAGDKMRICAFLWTYYGYPNSNYEGVNVEVMRYRNGEIMARDEVKKGKMPKVDYVAGVPDSGVPHAIGYANRSGKPFARPFVKYTPHLAPLLHARRPEGPRPGGQDEADPRARAHRGQEAPLRGRLHRPGHPAPGHGGLPL